MLQKIPEIIQVEFQEGNIKAKKAIFTIGLSHLPKIIRYLKENRIRIFSSLLAMDQKEDYAADLNLKKENFGVSIILPQTLARDRKTLQMTGVEEIIAQHRGVSSFQFSPHPGN
jgi:hypothetical protein